MDDDISGERRYQIKQTFCNLCWFGQAGKHCKEINSCRIVVAHILKPTRR
jgi:hypothetical protein